MKMLVLFAALLLVGCSVEACDQTGGQRGPLFGGELEGLVEEVLGCSGHGGIVTPGKRVVTILLRGWLVWFSGRWAVRRDPVHAEL